jgi:kynurenine formamidase
VVEALYDSANKPSRKRVIDLSLPVSNSLRGVNISSAKTIAADGWNATTLTLYSHSGTHMDAPKHFLPEGASLDQQDLAACCGPARIVNLAPVQPRQLLTISDIESRIGSVNPGDRLLFRTDWHRRVGSPEYRDGLPRISIELAQWLVEKRVALIGVEPPSVADVNNMVELTEVHQTLFRGGVVIVEGLAHLDQITQAEVEFIALPLKIVDGDGCPVRAIAIETA